MRQKVDAETRRIITPSRSPIELVSSNGFSWNGNLEFDYEKLFGRLSYCEMKETGGGKRDRTDDLRNAIATLYQLSYTPDLFAEDRLTSLRGRVGLCLKPVSLSTIFLSACQLPVALLR